MPADIDPSPITEMTLLRPPGRDRGRGMGGAEGVVFAFGAPGESRQAMLAAQGADAIAAAGQDLVRIGLVADVPDQPVGGRVEDIVQGHRQLDDAQSRSEMAAGLRDDVDEFGAQFRRELREIAFGKRPQVRRNEHPVEQRRLWSIGHFGVSCLWLVRRRFIACK
jgi:hypothetical protein